MICLSEALLRALPFLGVEWHFVVLKLDSKLTVWTALLLIMFWLGNFSSVH